MEQHAVPQDITGFKFKLVGDMTLKQFGELAFGIIMAYLFYASNWNPLLKWPLVLFFGIFGLALAFVPIEERSLDVWIINFFKAIYKPTFYVWKKTDVATLSRPPVMRESRQTSSEPMVQAAPNMASVSTVPPATQPPGATPIETAPTTSTPTTNSWPYGETPPFKKPAAETTPGPSEAATPSAGEAAAPEPVPTVASAGIPEEGQKTVPEGNAVIENTGSQNQPQTGGLSIEELMQMREKKVEENPPVAQGEEVKTILGEPMEQPSVPVQNPMTVEDLLKQRSQTSAANNQKVAVELSEKEKSFADLGEQNKAMLMQIDELRNQIYALQMEGKDIGNLQQRLDEILKQKSELAAKIAEARDKMIATKVAPLTSPAYQEPVVRAAPKPMSQSPTKPPPMISLTPVPNVINGLVMDVNGVPLTGVIIIIKDSIGNSIRALRTNKVGQFIASTPLIDGTYYLELEKAGYGFEPWEINLSGFVLPPIEIRASSQESQAATEN